MEMKKKIIMIVYDCLLPECQWSANDQLKTTNVIGQPHSKLTYWSLLVC